MAKKVDTIKVKMILSEAPKRENKTSGKSSKSKNDVTYQESIIDHKITWLAKMDPLTEESKTPRTRVD